MISLNGTEAFTPEWLKDQPDAPVYYIRVGNVTDRGNFEAELSGKYRAGRVFGFEMAQAFTNGVTTLLGDDPERDTLIEMVNREAGGEVLEAADRQLLAQARDVLAEHWPEYASLLEQSSRRRELAPIVAFRRFVVAVDRAAPDWTPDNPAREHIPFARGLDGLIREADLKAVDPLELVRVGNEAVGLLYATGEERNFPQPSKSGDAPQTSPSAATSKEGGKSGASAGKKTRASRSRRGSGR